MPRVRVPRLVAQLVAPLVVDYFAYAERPGASARRAARHEARRAARRRLLRLRRASGCLGTSRCSSRGLSRRSSSTTSPTPSVRVPRHIARLVTRLVSPLIVDYFAYAARPGASARRAARHSARHAARRRLLRVPRLRLAATMALLHTHRVLRLLVSRQHWLYFKYAARRRDVVFWSHRVDHSSRLVFQTSRERQSRPQQIVGINSD
jgi:hypothetical protein